MSRSTPMNVQLNPDTHSQKDVDYTAESPHYCCFPALYLEVGL